MNNKNLFNELFRYRENPKKTPLEDYTTEILRYFLEYEPEILKFFLRKCGINYKAGNVCIESQAPLGNNRVDILIKEKEKNFALVIENKIESGFRDGQIADYKSDVSSLLGKGKKGYVLALTKYYTKFTDRVGVPDHKMQWFELGNFLEEEKSFCEAKLVAQFFTFLKENGMKLTKTDFTLVEGLKARKNFIEMFIHVLDTFVESGDLGRAESKKNKYVSHAKNYESFINYTLAYKKRINNKVHFVLSHDEGVLHTLIHNLKSNEEFLSAPAPYPATWKSIHRLMLSESEFLSKDQDVKGQRDILEKFVFESLEKAKEVIG